jgi:Na+/H+ antiporter NhaC
VRALSGWWSLAPPLLAIVLAVLFRQAVAALLAGVWVGVLLIRGGDPLSAFLGLFGEIVVPALADTGHATLLLFTFAMGGMLGVVARAGGTRGIVRLVAPLARGPRSGQLATWGMGLIVFFDDYANTLLVGGTMRPVTDRLRISREKLAYLVDSTAAPVASLAVVSTWIGTEIGYIGEAFDALGMDRDPYLVFVQSLPYRFYPILALVFGVLVAVLGRDFGPMLGAERRARATGATFRPGSRPAEEPEPAGEAAGGRWIMAVIPILVMLGTILAVLVQTGREGAAAQGLSLDLRNVFGAADSYAALLQGSFLGSAAAVLLAVGGRALNLREAVDSWIQGAASIFTAAVILTLAWSINTVAGELHTAGYLVHLLGDALDPRWLPALVFILSGLTSFATGSSWSTMGILVPLVIPLAVSLAPGSETILLGTVSSVLAGAVWGDHCSPISDTTVLSSLASSVDHMDHVNTQLPYALVVGAVSILFGDVLTAFGFPFWGAWILGAGSLVLILRFAGRRSEA